MKERIAKHLRTADEIIRTGRYDEAMREVEAVLRIDPKNYYARSFQERIRYFQRKAQQQVETQAEEMDRRVEVVSQLLQTADKYIELKDYKRALDQIAKVFAIDPKNYYAQSYSDRIDMLMHEQMGVESVGEKKRPIPAPVPRPKQPEFVPEKASEDTRASVSMYRELLKEMWFDGKLTDDEVEELEKVRETFGISMQQHEELHKEVKVDAYVDALRIAWRDGVVTMNEKEALELMRKKFAITLEEHMSAEAKILWAKGTPSVKGTILIVDDESGFLHWVAGTLRKHGYEVVTAETVEDALRALEGEIPALILADVVFPEPGLNGFEFYGRVRENQRWKNIPFLLMSAISDEFVVRAGMRLGVNNFITKPFNFEL
ncbi:MAG: response regulator, partial [Bacteroidota bacterium]